MKNIFVIALLLSFLSCRNDDNFAKEKRYIEKIVITEAKLAGHETLSGPDMKVVIQAEGMVKESERFDDVAFLPLTFEDVAFQLKDSAMLIQVYDHDEFDPDDLMFTRLMSPYSLTEEGNPFRVIRRGLGNRNLLETARVRVLNIYY